MRSARSLRTIVMLRRGSIRLRIIVLVLVPVIALIGLYGIVLSLTLGNFLTLRRAASFRNEITAPVSAIQLRLSSERGLALAYLADPTSVRLTQFVSQEQSSDSAIRAFQADAAAALGDSGSTARQSVEGWRASLATLGPLRMAMLRRDLSRIAAAGAYTTLISGGNNVLNQTVLPLLTT